VTPTVAYVPSGLSLNARPILEPAECWFELPISAEVTCGFLTVPEDRTKPLTPDNTLRLAVAIIYSSAPSPRLDPVFVVHSMDDGDRGAQEVKNE
jgi:hypothetical protein